VILQPEAPRGFQRLALAGSCRGAIRSRSKWTNAATSRMEPQARAQLKCNEDPTHKPQQCAMPATTDLQLHFSLSSQVAANTAPGQPVHHVLSITTTPSAEGAIRHGNGPSVRTGIKPFFMSIPARRGGFAPDPAHLKPCLLGEMIWQGWLPTDQLQTPHRI